MAPTKKYTHVRRASPGFTLIEIIIVVSLIGIILAIASINMPKGTDVFSETFDPRFQQEVTVLHIKPSGDVVVRMNQYGTPTTTDYVWTDYRVLERTKAASHSSQAWHTYGHSLSIKLKGEVTVGQKMGLWYIYSKKKLRNGESFEEVSAVKVCPLGASPDEVAPEAVQ